MIYMNEYEIEDAKRRFAAHPILGPATKTLANLCEWTNANSDGWPFWPKPCRAAAKLQELIMGGDRFDDEREDVTVAQYQATLRAIRMFRARQSADFDIVEP